MNNLAKQVAGSRAGKTGNQLFDHFKQPLSAKKRKIGIPEDRKQIAGMVKVTNSTVTFQKRISGMKKTS